jgi:polyferredoxin
MSLKPPASAYAQDREHNFCLNFFWDYWWPGIFLVYPFLGRIWCSICPFMIYGEVVQRWRMANGATLLRWPRDERVNNPQLQHMMWLCIF